MGIKTKDPNFYMRYKFFYLFVLLVFAFAKLNAQIEIELKAPEEEMDPNQKKDAKSDARFKVGLFLPFFAEGTDTTPQKHAFALSSMDYLAGLKVAIDSIEKTGKVMIDLFVEDTELDSSRVEDLLMGSKYKDLDLLIGPIFQSGVEMAESFIQHRKTMLYMPFEKEFIVKNQGKLITSQKNTHAFASFFASYFIQQYNSKPVNFVLIHSGKEGKIGRESKEIDSLINEVIVSKSKNITVSMLDISAKENATFVNKLDKSQEYVFFLNTRNSYYANIALNQILKIFSSVSSVYCMEELLASETPLYEVWDTMHVKFFSRFFVNFEDESIGQFRKKIIDSYNQEPVEFTYKGYNDLLLLSEIFSKKDTWLNDCLNKNYFNGVSGYYFNSDPVNKGIFNGFHGVWQYENLKLYRAF